MLSKLLVRFYLVWHGRLGLPGAGWLIRRFASVLSGLRDYPFEIAGVGTARLDLRDLSAFGLLNVYLGETRDLDALTKWLAKSIQAGDVLWDVGANVGYLDLLIARLHPELKVIHAFEPNPRAYRSLQSLFSDYPNVVVHPIGLGRADATLELNAPPDGSAIGSLVHSVEGSVKVPVQIRGGDNYRVEKALPLPNFIKIDVEGFEVDVIAGLPATIAEAQPIILFEYTFLTDEQIKTLAPLGYVLFLILDDGRITRDLTRRAEGHDGLLVPNKSVDQIVKGEE